VPPRCEVCGHPRAASPCPRCGGTIAHPELLRPPRGHALGEFAVGLRLATRGARLTVRTPQLLLLVLLPLAISVLLFAAMVALLWHERGLVRPELAAAWPLGLDWLRRVVRVAAEGLGVLIGIGFALVATIVASQAINAPFLERLSQAVESLVVGRPDRTPFSLRRLWHVVLVPLVQAVVMAALQAAFGLLFLLLSMSAVGAPLAALGSLWLVALTLCDVTIARKGFPVRERFRRVAGDLPLYLGLALPFFLAPFLLPLGVAGATFADLRARGARIARGG
jgi:uncharacterized protein involved in cysteine biosynthesis